MGDKQHGLPGLGPDIHQFFLERKSSLRVQGAERLVHEQYWRVKGQSGRERDTLAHAARQLSRKRRFEALQSRELDKLANLSRALGGGNASN